MPHKRGGGGHKREAQMVCSTFPRGRLMYLEFGIEGYFGRENLTSFLAGWKTLLTIALARARTHDLPHKHFQQWCVIPGTLFVLPMHILPMTVYCSVYYSMCYPLYYPVFPVYYQHISSCIIHVLPLYYHYITLYYTFTLLLLVFNVAISQKKASCHTDITSINIITS